MTPSAPIAAPAGAGRRDTVAVLRHRAWQALTVVLLVLGYGGYYLCRSHLSVATPLIILGLLWFLRATGYGLAARATAENSDRARLLGVRVKRVSLIVWVIAGILHFHPLW